MDGWVPDRLQFEFALASDPGLRRRNNEDSVLSDSSVQLALVADGMGGYKAGEVASAIAARVVLDDLREAIEHPAPLAPDLRPTRGALLRSAIEHANRQIFDAARRFPECRGMGTTIAAILFHDQRAVIAHVGDSRVYRMREGRLLQVTQDHSLVQELINRGIFTPEEAHETTPRNLVTRALGIEPDVEVDVQETDVAHNDIYLICSDGLTDMVGAEDIRLTLDRYGANLPAAAQGLVAIANAGGGRDNISVVLARPLPDFDGQDRGEL